MTAEAKNRTWSVKSAVKVWVAANSLVENEHFEASIHCIGRKKEFFFQRVWPEKKSLLFVLE